MAERTSARASARAAASTLGRASDTRAVKRAYTASSSRVTSACSTLRRLPMPTTARGSTKSVAPLALVECTMPGNRSCESLRTGRTHRPSRSVTKRSCRTPSYRPIRSSMRESIRWRAACHSLRSSRRRGLARSASVPSGSKLPEISSARSSRVGSVEQAANSAGAWALREARKRRKALAAPSRRPMPRSSAGDSTPPTLARSMASRTSSTSPTGKVRPSSSTRTASADCARKSRVCSRVSANGKASASSRPSGPAHRDATAPSTRSHSRSERVLGGQGSGRSSSKVTDSRPSARTGPCCPGRARRRARG